MADERRFSGRLAEEYELLELAYPDFRSFQRRLAERVAQLHPAGEGSLQLLELGPGNGFTTELVLEAADNLVIDAIDNEPKMIAQLEERLGDAVESGKLRPIERDALEWVRAQPDESYDGFFSAFTLHNLTVDYREMLLPELLRVLRPAGLFVNADKYAPDGQAQFEALSTQIGRFFDAFLPLEKYELLRDWVLHNVMDQAPVRCQRESSAVERMKRIGFDSVTVSDRSDMQAILSAFRPADTDSR